MAYYADAWSALARWGDEARTPQMILVGVDNIDRYRDLRPLQQNGEPAGIEDFTRFLSEEVIPFIEREYRTAGYRILAGPQAGAVFCLYTLQNHPDLFDAFILNNPLVSEPNTNFLLDQAESFYSGTESLRKFFYIIYGGAGESPEAVAAVERFARMTEPAREHGFDLRLDDISGNDEFIPPLHIKEGLRVLFSDYYLPPDRLFSSLADIRTFYDGLSKSFGYDVAPGEWVMTRSADALIEQGEAVPATEILEYQTSLYPNMVNGWWRLAGLAAGRGDTEEAIRLYEKCVEINPSMSNFVERRINSLRQTE
jgi:tetratricopeptide (TPR) repeat protein